MVIIYKYLFIILLLAAPVSACAVDNSHWVKIQFVDINNTPVQGFVIIQQQVYDDLYSLWLMSMFGYNHTEYENLKEQVSYHYLWTDPKGYVEAPMYETMRYNITIYNRTTYDPIKTYTIYPRESGYIFVTENK